MQIWVFEIRNKVKFYGESKVKKSLKIHLCLMLHFGVERAESISHSDLKHLDFSIEDKGPSIFGLALDKVQEISNTACTVINDPSLKMGLDHSKRVSGGRPLHTEMRITDDWRISRDYYFIDDNGKKQISMSDVGGSLKEIAPVLAVSFLGSLAVSLFLV